MTIQEDAIELTQEEKADIAAAYRIQAKHLRWFILSALLGGLTFAVTQAITTPQLRPLIPALATVYGFSMSSGLAARKAGGGAVALVKAPLHFAAELRQRYTEYASSRAALKARFGGR